MTPKQKRAQAEFIRAARQALCLRQHEFAALLGVHPMTVSKWERVTALPSAWHVTIIEALATSPYDDGTLKDILVSKGVAFALCRGLEHLNR